MSEENADKKPSARSRLKKWIRDELKAKPEVTITDFAKRALKHVIADRSFMNDLARELLRPLIYEEVRLAVAESRKPGQEELVQLGDQIVTREGLKQRAASLRRSWVDWLEHAGDRHVLLMEMDDNDLLLAENERRKRGDAEHELADLWRALRSRLESGQKVRDVWSAEEIEATRASIANQRKAA